MGLRLGPVTRPFTPRCREVAVDGKCHFSHEAAVYFKSIRAPLVSPQLFFCLSRCVVWFIMFKKTSQNFLLRLSERNAGFARLCSSLNSIFFCHVCLVTYQIWKWPFFIIGPFKCNLPRYDVKETSIKINNTLHRHNC